MGAAISTPVVHLRRAEYRTEPRAEAELMRVALTRSATAAKVPDEDFPVVSVKPTQPHAAKGCRFLLRKRRLRQQQGYRHDAQGKGFSAGARRHGARGGGEGVNLVCHGFEFGAGDHTAPKLNDAKRSGFDGGPRSGYGRSAR